MTTATDQAPQTEPKISRKQQNLLNKLLADAGMDTSDRPAIHDFLSGLIGRKIESRRDLTSDEASHLIDGLLEDKPTVHEAISRVLRDVGHRGVGKTGVNTDQGYSFRGIDDMVDALSPLLARHEVVIVPKVRSVDHQYRTSSTGRVNTATTMIVDWSIIGPRGDSLAATTVGLGMDVSDKSVNKAMTGAYKYLLSELFCIPNAGWDEGDLTTPDSRVDVEAERKEANKPKLEQLAVLAAGQNLSMEEITARFRRENGDLSLTAFESMQTDRLSAFVRDVEAWIATKAATPQS